MEQPLPACSAILPGATGLCTHYILTVRLLVMGSNPNPQFLLLSC